MSALKGKFDVGMQPQSDTDFDVGRMILDKTYHGDVLGTGKGQMLSHVTNVKGSAGYVAIEKFEGTVDGKQGSFVLQHVGVMEKRAQTLSISIIPDSGTDQLTGITGTMEIDIVDGQHYYTLKYIIE